MKSRSALFPGHSLALSALVLLATALPACGGGGGTWVKSVDHPTGSSVEYGTPKDKTYSIDVDPQREKVRITIFEEAKCDVIPVTVMQRYQVTYKGDKEVSRTPMNKRQVAGDAQKTIACNQTWARNVEVLLDIGGTRFSLGKTNKYGAVGADLARLFDTGNYEVSDKEAKVILRPAGAKPPVEVGALQLGELSKRKSRVDELLAQLEAVLAKGETGASPDEITESYKAYSQLIDLAGDDPRVEGMAARFWELLYGRKQEEAREKLGKNLAALEEAKEVLKAAGDAAIPLYVQAAVSSGYMDRRALEWSSLRLIRAIKGAPQVCASGFSFSKVPSYKWPADAQIAASYTNYGYGSSWEASAGSFCR